ncbi:recombinase [archaeon]|nr:recombinase [archaeon]
MLEFQSIKWKNFLSTGNNFTEVALNKSSTTLILGTNGAGKSTILDALTFGLFGKPFRKINKPQLTNSINDKDCLIEINFQIGKTKYMVRRGIKPTIFEIYHNGKLIDQDSKAKDYQKYLEENILKLNYKSFTQTVILGSATFVPFMQLNANDRRDIIEDLLDIKIFSIMNENLKQRQSLLKDDIDTNTLERDKIEYSIDMQERYMENAAKNKAKKIKTNNEKISEKETEVSSAFDEIEIINSKIIELTESISDFDDVKKKQNKLDSLESQLIATGKKHKKDIDFFETIETCPSCKQSVEDEHRCNIVDDKKSKIEEINTAVEKLSKQFKVVNSRLSEITTVQDEIYKLNSKVTENNTTIRMIQKNIKEIQEENDELNNDETSITELKKEMKKLTTSLSKLDIKRKELVEQREYYNVSSMLLKDTGVKTSIIKYYLPKMNGLINKYLKEMDFYINFTMDEKFSENIKSRGRENFSYASFSEGEKMRIDLALLFTWRAIAKMKNSVNTNLLILDEVFDSSLDNSGTDEFLKLLNTLGGNNVFVISHKGEILYDKFHSVIKFDKVKNFSQIVQEK